MPLRDAAAKFVCMDFRPAYGVNGKGVVEYLYAGIQLAKLYPNMTRQDLVQALPSRNTVTSHIKKIADVSVATVSEMLKKAIASYGSFGVTCDLWTEKLNTTEFIAITVHFFVQTSTGLELKAMVIDICEMAFESMTNANIRATIIKVFGTFGISEDNLLQHASFVTDRGSNILAAVRDFEHHACLAHLCNNVVNAMVGITELKDIVKNASDLVRFVKKGHIASQMTSKLKSHVETRWNTVYDMLMSIIENYQELYDLLKAKADSATRHRNKLDKLTCLSIEELRAICKVLSFFKLVTMTVEGDQYVTLQNYWITLRELKNVLTVKYDDTALVVLMKNAGLQYINQSESLGHFQPTIKHKLAVFLNPQMKSLRFASPAEKKEITDHVQVMIQIEITAPLVPVVRAQIERSETPSTSTSSIFQEYLDTNGDNRDGNNNNNNNELERYIVSKVETVIIKFIFAKNVKQISNHFL